jgi:aminopeptidase
MWLDRPNVRPHRTLPSTLALELEDAAASAFVASSSHHELGMRQHLLHLVRTHAIRHAHMPGISRLAFAHGGRIDYRKVAALGERLLEKLRRGRTLESHSEVGTHLGVELSHDGRWYAQLGVLEPGRWGNFPAGALYASPETVEGTFVANASVGEFFGERERLLARTPVALTIEGGRVRRVRSSSRELERDVEAMLAFGPNSDRVGIVAIGVNFGITTATGEALVDQNLPGLHLGIGDPAARVTGASWSAPTSFAACQSDSTLVVDGAIVVHRGKLLSPS